jgi:hypothetical protein
MNRRFALYLVYLRVWESKVFIGNARDGSCELSTSFVRAIEDEWTLRYGRGCQQRCRHKAKGPHDEHQYNILVYTLFQKTDLIPGNR